MNKICALCGENPATTEDHIPPQGIYPKSTRKGQQLHWVPACSSCNNGSSVEDELFKIIINFETGEYRPDQTEIIESMAKTLGFNKKLGRNVFTEATRTYQLQQNGLLKPVVAVPFDTALYSKVIARMVKGLYWRENGKILGKNTEIKVFPMSVMESGFLESVKTLMATLEPRKLNQGSFVYKVIFAQDGSSIWGMQFFGIHTVFARAEKPTT